MRAFVLLAALCVVSCRAPRADATRDRTTSVSADAASAVLDVSLVVRPKIVTPARRPSPEPTKERLLDELRDAKEIGGRAIGIGGHESTFHRIARELLPTASVGFLRWLAEDEHPNLRVMGFWGLALQGDADLLLHHACDRERVSVCSGCSCEQETVGELARRYLTNPRWSGTLLTAADAGSTLLVPVATTALSLKVASTDGCEISYAERRQWVDADWSWSLIRATAPTVPTWKIVKAIAPLSPALAKPTLIAVLDDGSQSLRARLSAASGLTRSVDADAEAAILRNAAFLDASQGGLSKDLAEVIRIRRKADSLMEPIRAVHTWMETEKVADNAILAYRLKHPLVLDVVAHVSYGARDEDVDRARDAATTWVVDHLSDHEACWDTYRDMAYELELRTEPTTKSKPPAVLRAKISDAIDRLERKPCSG